MTEGFETKISNDDVNKSSPEYSFYHKVSAFFEDDDDITVSAIYGYEFTIYVHDEKKYEILKQVLYVPQQAEILKVNIVYTGEARTPKVSDADLAYLLSGNKYFSRYISSDENGLTPAAMRYICMKPEVVQYYDDVFNSPTGSDTKTAEALARELFHGCKCNITTDVKE